jgi:hypothetical protein
MDQTSTTSIFYTAPPTIQGGSRASASISPGSGAISGGLLRPGAIDQPKFKALLQAAQAAQATLGATLPPGAGPTQQSDQASVINGIPTLTPAQFALLTGGQTVPDAQTPNTQAPNIRAPKSGSIAEPTVPPTLVSGKPASGDLSAEVAAALGPQAEQTPAAEPAQKPEPTPAEDDPRVVHFKRMPDKDERKALAASGKRWVVDETPGSRKLFFGDDEVFGLDDLADLVNPLQHIPVVSQIYRAVTGDEINGAAELLGALPFGPSSFLTSVADLAVRETTGKDMGGNVIAMLFGSGDTPSNDGLAAAKEKAIPANTVQTAAIAADLGPGQSRRIADRDNGGHEG